MDLHPDFIETCRSWIAQDTSPQGGTLEAARWLADHAAKQGFHCQLLEDNYHGVEQANLIISLPQAIVSFDLPRENALFLQAHMDTVDPGPLTHWTHNLLNPFHATIEGKKIYGLGTVEVKLDILCKLEAMKEALTTKKVYSGMFPALLCTYGEELGMYGMSRLLRRGALRGKYAVISEPSGLRPVVAMKGFAGVEIFLPFSTQEKHYRMEHDLRESTSTKTKIFSGKASHSSKPELGDSAIVKMMEFVMQLPDGISMMEIEGGVNANTIPSYASVEFDMIGNFADSMVHKLKWIHETLKTLEAQFLTVRDEDFDPPITTLNVGMIRTDIEGVTLIGCCRWPLTTSEAQYSLWMEELKAACGKVDGSCRVMDHKRPYRLKADSTLVQEIQRVLSDMGLRPDLITQSNTNEASLLNRLGIECISIGPGKRESNAHTPHENIELSELKEAIIFYQKLMERMCT